MRHRATRHRRTVHSLALAGLFGCLTGALIGEGLIPLLIPPEPVGRVVDVAFALDVSGSMQPVIDGLRSGFARFARVVQAEGLDVRSGLVGFRDCTLDEELVPLRFGPDGRFTRDPAAFAQALDGLDAEGGGASEEESSLDGLAAAAELPFRPGARRVAVLVSDAGPMLPDRRVASLEKLVALLRRARIDELHLVVPDVVAPAYAPLRRDFSGRTFSLEATAGADGFEAITAGLGESIAAGAPSLLQPDGGDGRWDRLLLVSCAWSSLLALGLSLALTAALQRRRGLDGLKADQVVGILPSSLLAGSLAGGLGQLAYASGLSPGFARIAAWTLLGTLLGFGSARMVPELQPGRAASAGALAGALGACGLLMTPGDGGAVARLIAAGILGSALGVLLTVIHERTKPGWVRPGRFRPERRSLARSWMNRS